MARSNNNASAKESTTSTNSPSTITVEDVLKETLVFMGIYVVSRMAITYLVKQYQHSHSNYPSSKESLNRLQNIFSKSNASQNSKNTNELNADTNTPKRPKISEISLNQYEAAIASDVIDPTQIPTRFQDIGGIDDMKSELWDLVVLPLRHPELFISKSGLVSPPRGVLLYGAPGTGKTMLAKAMAGEGSAAFINVRLSSIMDKWFGESNKLVSAVFSLAQKLAPSVIFIDELDTFLNQRDGSENSATSTMKSEFLTLWDGMLTQEGKDVQETIMVLGATNRPFDVDSAILRRLPRTFEIGLPNEKSRLQILALFLEKQEMSRSARKLLPKIAKVTIGYSGSDLKELCRAAAMEPIRELMKEQSQNAVSGKSSNNITQKMKKIKARSVEERDFMAALQKVKRTGATAMNFQRKEQQKQNQFRSTLNTGDLAKSLALLQEVFSSQHIPGKERGEENEGTDEIPNLSAE